MNELIRLMAVVAGCLATFTGTVLTSYGVYAVICIFVTDDPVARSLFEGCAPLLLILGVSVLLAGIVTLRRLKRSSPALHRE